MCRVVLGLNQPPIYNKYFKIYLLIVHVSLRFFHLRTMRVHSRWENRRRQFDDNSIVHSLLVLRQSLIEPVLKTLEPSNNESTREEPKLKDGLLSTDDGWSLCLSIALLWWDYLERGAKYFGRLFEFCRVT